MMDVTHHTIFSLADDLFAFQRDLATAVRTSTEGAVRYLLMMSFDFGRARLFSSIDIPRFC
jgi:hypothetical protein